MKNLDNNHKEASLAPAAAKSAADRAGGEASLLDARPEATVQRRLQAMANGHPEEHPSPVQRQENKTGLPDNLKSGIENLSGLFIDDVRVHRNSDKPAQLNALAYAQGTDIHLAAGQEKHLAHEAWHVVQQKQGRVKPTRQMKGKVAINDDAGLEKEADVMGAKAQQLVKAETPQNAKNGTARKKGAIAQRVGQDEVQAYIEGIAPDDGPIRDYIDDHASDNGGLCAGWVVMHRKNPKALLKMWKLVEDRMEEQRGLGGKRADEAVKMYIEAQFHFANDPDNADFEAPDESTLKATGIHGETDDTNKKITTKKNVRVKNGEIYQTAFSILEKYKGSKKLAFIEIYDQGHTTQIEFVSGKPNSVSETEIAGIVSVSSGKEVEKILRAWFFRDYEVDDEVSVTMSFDLYVPR